MRKGGREREKARNGGQHSVSDLGGSSLTANPRRGIYQNEQRILGHVNRSTGFRIKEVKTLLFCMWVKLDLENGDQGRSYNVNRTRTNWKVSFSSDVRMDQSRLSENNMGFSTR